MPRNDDDLTLTERLIWQACLDVPSLRKHYEEQGITQHDWDSALGKASATHVRTTNRILNHALLKLRTSERVRHILTGYIHRNNHVQDTSINN